MKKIVITISLLAILVVVACNTSKSNMATTATPTPPPVPEKPVKGELKESQMKVTEPQYEKKAIPVQKNRLKAVETAAILPDSL